MDGIKDALLRMVQAGRDARRLQEAFATIGLNEELIFSIFGNIGDAIYYLVGEKTDEFEDSVTYEVLTNDNISNYQAAEILMEEFKKNCVRNCEEQPKPHTIEPEEMRKMVRKNGGYMPTPEGEWQ